MAASSERRSRIVEALGFWFVTLVICAVAGFGSYRFGREWIGDRLDGDVKSVLTRDDVTNSITPESFAGGVEEEPEIADEPPKEAIVEVIPVEVSPADEEALSGERSRVLPDRSQDADDPEDADEPDAASTDEDEDAPADEPDEAAVSDDRPESGDEFVVRAGSFNNRANAQARVKELRDQGYQPYVTTVTVDGKEYTRVNVASYEDRDRALKLRDALRGEGYDSDIGTE